MDPVGGADKPVRRAFSLVEIVIALAILSFSLAVLVQSEAGSVVMTMESQRVLTANALANQKIAEVLLQLEVEGYTDTDKSEEGSFDDFGADGLFGEAIDFEGEYDDYSWAWTVREVDMQMGDVSSAISDLQGMGLGSEESSEDTLTESLGESDLAQSMMGSMLGGDALNEMLAPWMREVRVVVWWGDDPGDLESEELCEHCVELVTHVFNPSGEVISSSSSSSTSEEE